MIRHIVAWKFKEYANGATAMENAMELKRRLETMQKLQLFPGLESLSVHLNCQREEMEEAQDRMVYDAVLDSTFTDGQSLEACKERPEHKEITEFCESVLCARAAVDLIVD